MAVPPPPNNNAGFHVGGVGVPGAQVELLDSMQPEQHILQQRQQQQQQQQQQYYQQPQQSQQFEQQYQQSFFTQPNMAGTPATTVTSQQQMAPPSTVPLNTNSIGDGSPGYSVGGVGVPGAQVEVMPLVQPGQDSLLGGQLDSIQHASASRPPVGPLDLPAPAAAAAPIPVYQPELFSQNTGPPIIQIERQATMPQQQQQQQPTQQQQFQQQQQQAGQQTVGAAPVSASPVAPAFSHIASESAVAAAAAAHAANASTRGRRRSSLAVLADKFRPSSGSRSPSLSRRLSRTLSRHSMDEEEEEYEAGGPYADIKIAQKEYLAKVRAEQAKKNITTNIDGLPIPSPSESQRRRSSFSHILGLDKPLLSR